MDIGYDLTSGLFSRAYSNPAAIKASRQNDLRRDEYLRKCKTSSGNGACNLSTSSSCDMTQVKGIRQDEVTFQIKLSWYIPQTCCHCTLFRQTTVPSSSRSKRIHLRFNSPLLETLDEGLHWHTGRRFYSTDGETATLFWISVSF